MQKNIRSIGNESTTVFREKKKLKTKCLKNNQKRFLAAFYLSKNI